VQHHLLLVGLLPDLMTCLTVLLGNLPAAVTTAAAGIRVARHVVVPSTTGSSSSRKAGMQRQAKTQAAARTAAASRLLVQARVSRKHRRLAVALLLLLAPLLPLLPLQHLQLHLLLLCRHPKRPVQL
jgi:hypothetical protein